jgi:hypothetical protein
VHTEPIAVSDEAFGSAGVLKPLQPILDDAWWRKLNA